LNEIQTKKTILVIMLRKLHDDLSNLHYDNRSKVIEEYFNDRKSYKFERVREIKNFKMGKFYLQRRKSAVFNTNLNIRLRENKNRLIIKKFVRRYLKLIRNNMNTAELKAYMRKNIGRWKFCFKNTRCRPN